MAQPRYQFWRPIQPVKGDPIPDGAEYKLVVGGLSAWTRPPVLDAFIDVDTHREWRLPVEVVPIDLAADAIMQGFQFSEVFRLKGLPHLSVSFAGGLRAKTQDQLREQVVAKLRELSQEKTNATD